MTEYLTPETPDLLDIRLAWQSLAYTDQAILWLLIMSGHWYVLFIREIMNWRQKWEPPPASSPQAGAKENHPTGNPL